MAQAPFLVHSSMTAIKEMTSLKIITKSIFLLTITVFISEGCCCTYVCQL